MKSTLLKYKIGLAILLLFAVGLVVLVVVQAGGNKQDAATDKAASSIAGKLNNYVDTNGVIPSSLAGAGVHSVPSTITYQKLSDSSYKFCVTYKANSSGFDATGAVTDLATGSLTDTGSSNFSDSSDLFINTTHHKGANCQTIKPAYLNAQDIGSVGLCVGLQEASGSCQASGSNSTQSPKDQAAAAAGQASACGVDDYATHYAGTVSSIGTTDGFPVVATADQSLIVKIEPSAGSPKGQQVITIDQQANDIAHVFNVYNGACTTIDAATITTGDDVTVYLNNTDSNMPSAIIDFSRS